MFEAVTAAAKEYAARQTFRRRRMPVTNHTEASLLHAAAVRLAVSFVWAIVVGGLTYAGAWALDLSEDVLVPVSILSAVGAAIFVVFFAGGP